MSDKTIHSKSEKIQAKKHSKKTADGCEAVSGGVSPGGVARISSPLPVVLTGVDTLDLSFSADLPSSLINRLQALKSELQLKNDKSLFVPLGETVLFSFNLYRTGKKFYPYCLKSGDVSLHLSSRSSDSSIPSMRLSVGSMSCNNNIIDLLKSFRMWCDYHNIKIKEEKVSRIDLFADIEVPIDKARIWNQARMVSKAEKVAIYYSNRRLTGVQVGNGVIVLRMYDKIREMVDKQALHKSDFFQDLWQDDLEKIQFSDKKPKANILRVEFQLRREAVKQFSPGASDFLTLTPLLPSIWQYLTVEWFRQTEKAVDRLNKNQAHSTVSSFWLTVQSAMISVFRADRHRKVKNINIPALVGQAAGVMLTVCAGLGHLHTDFFGILSRASELVQERLAEVMDGDFFERDFKGRSTGVLLSF